MKSLVLAAKMAAVFALVMGAFVFVTLHLFTSTVIDGVNLSAAHERFVITVLWLSLVAMVLLVALSIYVTTPLRRMSRSMDRVAAGDLEHRVAVRGRDEGAAMARSFNAMAERVRGMIVGQKELMAGVSHELRSPLARMKVSLELMREGQGGVDRVADLEAEVDAIDDLLEELLLSSRLDLGTSPLAVEELDVSDLCRAAWMRVTDRAATKGMGVAVAGGATVPPVEVNRALVVRLFGNLFENAVRYAGRGTVTVSAERRADRLYITVADEGPGVEATELERLFEPFFRSDRARPRTTGTGGLGLMIVRRAVEAHGGRVLARRSDPRGLAVEFDLPVAPTGPTPLSSAGGPRPRGGSGCRVPRRGRPRSVVRVPLASDRYGSAVPPAHR